jgi:hypothetical protein
MADIQLIVKSRLKFDRAFLKMCLLKLYLAQEIDEKMGAATLHPNGVGFNKSDAPILTPLAVKVENEMMHDGPTLTETEIDITRHHMMKYVDQIIRLSLPEELI